MNSDESDERAKVVPLNKIWQFYACDYTQRDRRSMGYRCICGYIYTRGRYGIESGNLIICSEHLVPCGGCTALVLVPLLWKSREDLDVFVVNVHTRGGDVRLQPMSREWPRRVYCEPKK